MISKVFAGILFIIILFFLFNFISNKQDVKIEKVKIKKVYSQIENFEKENLTEEKEEEIEEEKEEDLPKLDIPELLKFKDVEVPCKECPKFYFNDDNCKCKKGKIRICIITNEFKGIDLHGGIGSEYYRLAKLLQENFEVTIGFVNYPYCEQVPNTDCKWDDWKEKYQGMGINFEPILNNSTLEGTQEMKNSHKSYLWLKERQKNFDIVHFHDYLGVGYYSFVAKKIGIDFQNNILVNGLHGTSWFVNRAQNRSPYDQTHLIMKYLEERSIEMSDVVISPSQFYINWLTDNQVNLPEKRDVLPNIIDETSIINDHYEESKIDHIVFFGRFSRVKGLDLFMETLKELSKENMNIKVTFLGNVEQQGIQGMSIQKFFQINSKNWKFPFTLLTGKDTEFCMKFLSQKGILTVIPSRIETFSLVVLELIFNKIPFIASKVGGIPEIVTDENNLFEPNVKSLTEKIKSVLSKGVVIPKPKYSMDNINNMWVKWHQNIYQNFKKNKEKELKMVLITVVMVCNNVKEFRITMDLLLKQSYKYFNLIVIDLTNNLDDIVKEYNNIKIVTMKGMYFDLLKLYKNSFNVANGDYIIFLNSGDQPKENMIEIYIKTISNQPDLEIISDVFIGLNFENLLILNHHSTLMIQKNYLLKNYKYNDIEIVFCKFSEILIEYILKKNDKFGMVPLKLNLKTGQQEYQCKNEIYKIYQDNIPYYLNNLVKFMLE